MTTKPKASVYNRRRDRQGAGTPEDRAEAISVIRSATTPSETTDGSRDAAEIDAIKDEGLTGRQLRIARRLAQKHNLSPNSDYEAVFLLRKQGIDPFDRANLLDLAAYKTDEKAPAKDKITIQLPQTTAEKAQTLPGPELSPSERRDIEITQIQRDIARRRRRKLLALFARLAVFVLLPTIVVGTYFYRYATPMYASKSAFSILQADGGGASFGGFLAGTQYATAQDSVATQEFLESKDALMRLEQDIGFSKIFKQDWIDPIQRLPQDASLEDTHKLYMKMVTIGYDPSDGIIRMEVAAPNADIAVDISDLLLSYAEETINGLSELKREDQMRDAKASFELAEEERKKAQEALIELQLQGALLDPENVLAGLRSRINFLETELQDKELQLAALLDNLRPNQAKVAGIRAEIARYEDALEELNAEMLDASAGENSLARLTLRIQSAQADLLVRDTMMQTALEQLETTRTEANRKVRYLSVSVNPVPSQDPSYPRKFENTILAFLLFAGIYLMISLTASVLREQVSS